ncbi:hypothetical protein PybrP1_008080 [[Pythium] brassicae (nom. inval.)]|nr:hypothetical protein PybrP1_008080 [[Pythium] brassicae (nom. inval.)]
MATYTAQAHDMSAIAIQYPLYPFMYFGRLTHIAGFRTKKQLTTHYRNKRSLAHLHDGHSNVRLGVVSGAV